MALVPDAQAATTAKLGPWNPYLMAICPAAVSVSIIGTANGLTRRGPSSSTTLFVSRIVPIPPTPLPITTPMREAVAGVAVRPASCNASSAAASAN